MKLSTIGQIAKQCWENIPGYFKNTQLDEFVIMPNHFHGIIVINDNNCGDGGMGLINQTHTPTRDAHTPTRNAHAPTIDSKSIENKKSFGDNNWIMMKNPNMILGKIIRFFKARSTRLIRQTGYKNFAWQRNYYEHIIQNSKSLQTIRRFIVNNPLKWDFR